MSSARLILKITAFLLIFCCLFSLTSRVMTVNPDDTLREAWATALFDEEPGSLDAVFIGSSNCVAYWNSMVAFREYGITVLPYAWDTQPLLAAEGLIREARKQQPDALYIVNINTVSEIEENPALILHNTLDFMPFSLDKLRLADSLLDQTDLTLEERMEYYLPILRYHSRWSILEPANLQGKADCFKVSNFDYPYLELVTDVSDQYVRTEETAPLSDNLHSAMESLLRYCEEEQVNVLFVTVPQAKDAITVGKYNTINAMAAEAGFPVLDLLNHPELLGLDPKVDFYNEGHTNIHGSMKFTHYLARYLVEAYGFSDKSQDPAYHTWSGALYWYETLITPWALDFELTGGHRVPLAAPVVTASAGETGTTLRWEAVEGAGGYAVYRKDTAGSPWTELGKTGACFYEDTGTGIYTVVPFPITTADIAYGSFDYLGVSPG